MPLDDAATPADAAIVEGLDPPASRPPRDGSLDALRGLTVVGMAVVNLQGPKAFPLLDHAPWNGLTFADLIFPTFLLVGGLAVPLALDAGKGRSVARLARRAALLVLIGVVFNVLFTLTLALPGVRASGVLQRIGVVYFACAAVALASRGWRLPLALAAVLLAAHAFVLLAVSAPGDAHPSLEAGRGISGWLDRTLLPGRIRNGYDPEGVLSTLSAVAEGLVGVAVMREVSRAADPRRALAIIAGAGAACLLAGALATGWLPLNKRLWTPSFTLVTAGAGLLAWAALRGVWPQRAPGALARGVVLLGRTALTFYVLHMLLMVVLSLKVDGSRLSVWAARPLAWLSDGWAPLAYALVWSAVCVALMFPLARRNWLLRI